MSDNLDKFLTLKQMEQIAGLLKKEEKKDDLKKMIEVWWSKNFWKVYAILIMLYPLIGGSYRAILKKILSD